MIKNRESKSEDKIETIMQIEGTVIKVETMSHRSVRVVIDSQEEVSPEIVSRLMDCYEKLGWFCFLPGKEKIEAEDLLDLPEIKDETDRKSPSQRLRAVMYIEWDHKSAAYKARYPSEVYYRGEMERIINSRKEKLPKKY